MADILKLNMNEKEGVQFCLYWLVSTLAWLPFANLNENGEPFSHRVHKLAKLFVHVFFLLLVVVLFETFVKPSVCRFSVTARHRRLLYFRLLRFRTDLQCGRKQALPYPMALNNSNCLGGEGEAKDFFNI